MDVELLSPARQLSYRRGRPRRALHGRQRPLQRQRLAPERHAHPQPLRELDQVAVVHARQAEGVDALDRQAGGDVVAHAVTWMWRAARSSGRAGAGAPSKSARAAVVLGNAITSRSEPAPARSIATRSNPTAKPPCGGAPAARADSRNPKRASVSCRESPRCPKKVRWTAGS